MKPIIEIQLEKRPDNEIIRLLTEENVRLSGELTVVLDCAKYARAAINKEHDKRVESGSEFDVGFSSGLSFALGAFSGVCEDDAKGATNA